jgi:hypothetical protein
VRVTPGTWASSQPMSRSERTVAFLAAGLVLLLGILAASALPGIFPNPHQRHDCAAVSHLSPQQFETVVSYLAGLALEEGKVPRIDRARIREVTGIDVLPVATDCLRAAVESRMRTAPS